MKSDRMQLWQELKKRVEREIQTLLTLPRPHSWPMTAQSGCECQIISFFGYSEKSLNTARPITTSEKVWEGKNCSTIRQAALMKHTGIWSRFIICVLFWTVNKTFLRLCKCVSLELDESRVIFKTLGANPDPVTSAYKQNTDTNVW